MNLHLFTVMRVTLLVLQQSNINTKFKIWKALEIKSFSVPLSLTNHFVLCNLIKLI